MDSVMYQMERKASHHKNNLQRITLKGITTVAL